jgi:predicted dehydrogenase
VTGTSRTLGYAVVGLGWIAQAAMLPAFRNARRNSRLVALVSGDAEKRRALAARYDLPASATYDYDEYDACLERDDVDAVYVAVPNHLHREYTVRAAEQGVHVLCEKPMAVTAGDCQAMIDACRAADVRLMIAYRLHLDPANLHAVDRVLQGAIGETRVFSATFTQQVEQGDIRLMAPEKGGGPLYDIGIYCINAVRYLFRAEPEAVWATRVSRPQPRFDDAAEAMSCVLRFSGSRLAAFTCSFGAHATSVCHLIGETGELRMNNAFSFRGQREVAVRTGDGQDGREFPDADQFGPQLLYFSDCILERRDPEPDGEEGLVDVRIIRALHESLEAGRMVDVAAARDRRPVPDQAISCPAVEEPAMVNAAEPSGDR